MSMIAAADKAVGTIVVDKAAVDTADQGAWEGRGDQNMLVAALD